MTSWRQEKHCSPFNLNTLSCETKNLLTNTALAGPLEFTRFLPGLASVPGFAG